MSPYGHWRRRIVHWISAFRARKILPTVKYVHLLHNDKFAKPFVDFLNRNFPTTEHLVLCQRTANHPFPTGPNVLEVRKFFKGINLDRPNIDKIICHSLFVKEIVDYFYTHPDLQRNKAYWLIYGGDLYEAPRDEKNDSVRRNFKGYINKIDEQYAKNKYGIDGYFWACGNLFPTLFIEPIRRIKSNSIRVQVNNSCDYSTIEILHELARFVNEDVVVTTIVSYGDAKAKEAIIRAGIRLFGDKFEYIEVFLTANDYVNYQNSNDILILDQSRQQGIGNLIVALKLGKKVFCRSDVSTFERVRCLGGMVYDTLTLPRLSFEEFICHPDENKEASRQFVNDFFSERSLRNKWQEFFNS